MRPFKIAPPSESTFDELGQIENKIFRLFRQRDALLAKRRADNGRSGPTFKAQLDGVENNLRRAIQDYLPYLASAVTGGRLPLQSEREELGRRATLEHIAIAMALSTTGHSHFLLKKTTRGKGKESSAIEDEAKTIAVQYIQDCRNHTWLDRTPIKRISADFGVEERTVQRWCKTFATRPPTEDPMARASDPTDREGIRQRRRRLLRRAASVYRDLVDR